MIFLDVTKTGRAAHRSGLMRVTTRLRASLATSAVEMIWGPKGPSWPRTVVRAPQPNDWLLTAELFSEEERPGFSNFLANRPCRLAGIFHDAIPLKHPQTTWPQSVARHPSYLKMLSRFDRIWAVSAASREELLGFWRWQGVEDPPPVDVLALGADFSGEPRIRPRTRQPGPEAGLPAFLTLGIIEPRKNQDFLLDVCAALWDDGARFELHVVGRVNPHFGRSTLARLKQLQKKYRPMLYYHEAANDRSVAQLYAKARATLFPTLAEGCGLPLLESLWAGVPCLCSDLAVLRENGDGGGCVAIQPNDRHAWQAALGRILRDDTWHAQLTDAATSRPLPTWAQAAGTLARVLA